MLIVLFLTPALHAAELMIQESEISIVDGDTILVTHRNQRQKIQLENIDAPEDIDNPKLQHDIKRTGLDQQKLIEMGALATEYFGRLIKLNTPFILSYNPNQSDRYVEGRIPGTLFNQQGQSVNELMILNGYAIYLSTKPANQNLIRLQTQAKSEKIGLWHYHPETFASWVSN